MLYPAELRARYVTACGDSIIAETSCLMKQRQLQRLAQFKLSHYPNFSYTVITLVGPKYFLSPDFNSFWHDPCLCRHERKSFSPLAIPTQSHAATSLVFQSLGIGKPGATMIGRRSGAQRGALEDKLRPEVFLDAPCIFPSIRVSPGRRQPSPNCWSVVELTPLQLKPPQLKLR